MIPQNDPQKLNGLCEVKTDAELRKFVVIEIGEEVVTGVEMGIGFARKQSIERFGGCGGGGGVSVGLGGSGSGSLGVAIALHPLPGQPPICT